jgi:hypothetical protein
MMRIFRRSSFKANTPRNETISEQIGKKLNNSINGYEGGLRKQQLEILPEIVVYETNRIDLGTYDSGRVVNTDSDLTPEKGFEGGKKDSSRRKKKGSRSNTFSGSSSDIISKTSKKKMSMKSFLKKFIQKKLKQRERSKNGSGSKNRSRSQKYLSEADDENDINNPYATEKSINRSINVLSPRMSANISKISRVKSDNFVS